jgi:adenine-specific DNA-methyltransferase
VLKTATVPSAVAPEEALTHERRRSLGIYYTPQSAARVMAEWAIREPTDTVLEPSFGGCAILQAGVWRLHQLGCERPAKQLLGFDVDRAAFAHLERLLHRQSAVRFVSPHGRAAA